MSRCRACNTILNDYEMTRKSSITGEYFDLCSPCFSYIRHDVHSKERIDLKDNSDEVEESDEEGLTDWK